MVIKNYLEFLEDLTVDEKTGMSLLRLTQDEPFSLYFASIKPGAMLPAHYHRHGVEAYQIISGAGTIEVGALAANGVAWRSATKIKAGDCFSIQAGQAHRLVNNGNSAMNIVFSTPPTHLAEDRYFINQ